MQHYQSPLIHYQTTARHLFNFGPASASHTTHFRQPYSYSAWSILKLEHFQLETSFSSKHSRINRLFIAISTSHCSLLPQCTWYCPIPVRYDTSRIPVSWSPLAHNIVPPYQTHLKTPYPFPVLNNTKTHDLLLAPSPDVLETAPHLCVPNILKLHLFFARPTNHAPPPPCPMYLKPHHTCVFLTF